MHLTDITANIAVKGLEPSSIVTIQAVANTSAQAVTVFYTLSDGTVKSRLLTEDDLQHIEIAAEERPWSFEGNAKEFKLALEAKRIELAYLFDPMMAVYSSNIEPLPHQISAVYEEMLPKQPLRFVLADDPGAGKTIMAGLLIKELIMRSDSERILIIAPGSLVEQWRDELYEKFSLDFIVYTNALRQTTQTGNPFADIDHLIVRLDQFSRNEEDQDKLAASEWDLVVFDEAHKLSAHFFGSDIKKTQRFRFAEKMAASTKHLLLMTATPHNGIEEDFQLFMSLLDSDRFAGKFRGGVEKAETKDLMRRMVKEDLRRFDGTPLFPERRAYTVSYTLSDTEMNLYEQVTSYVKDQMGKAEKILNGKKRSSVGFALTSLQRRLASSPEAIYKSLDRRLNRMEKLLDELINGKKPEEPEAETLNFLNNEESDGDVYDEDDLTGEEQEKTEEEITDQATVAQSKAELKTEIATLTELKKTAAEVVASCKDRKWEELSEILQGTHKDSGKNLLLDEHGRMHKLIIFTEYKDTLLYLKGRIEGLLGSTNQVATISGSTTHDDRRDIQEKFRTDENLRILIATDAAGEGINLQCAHLMVNYDLPWNPNRLEQRFGRIHRIGQTEVCHLWSLVASDTREGAVYERLLEKIETENTALGGKVFKILGEAFHDRSLKDMMIEAVRYGDDPHVRARLQNDIDISFDPEHLKALLAKDALATEAMSTDMICKIRDEMYKAEARKLQPHFLREFFLAAFDYLHGSYSLAEEGRYKIRNVPAVVIQQYRILKAKNQGHVCLNPVQQKYERVCFDKKYVRIPDSPDAAQADLLQPGHPLMFSLTHAVSDKFENLLQQGAVFLSETEYTDSPYILYLLTHEIKDGTGATISKRFQFIRMNPDGTTADAGYAPHLDLKPFSEDKRPLIQHILEQQWVCTGFGERAVQTAVEKTVPEHYSEVARNRKEYIAKVWMLVHERLTSECNYYIDLCDRLYKKGDKGNWTQAKQRLDELNVRMETRKKELDRQADIENQQPVLIGAALVITRQLLDLLEYGTDRNKAPVHTYAVDADSRRKIELAGMKAVSDIELAKGNTITDVSRDNCGWDITSKAPVVNGILKDNTLLEVKTRINTNDIVTVTHNEYEAGLNNGKKYVLAVVLLSADNTVTGVWYWRNPFIKELNPGVDSMNIAIADIQKNGVRVC